MKVCPVCSSVYASSATTCRNDGSRLEELLEEGDRGRKGRRGRRRGRRATSGGQAWDDYADAGREDTIVYHGQANAIAEQLGAALAQPDDVAAQAAAEQQSRATGKAPRPRRSTEVKTGVFTPTHSVDAPVPRSPVNYDQPTQAFSPRAPSARPTPPVRTPSAPIIPPTGAAKRLNVTGGNATAQVGTLIDGRYRVEEVLGRGGMGTVYRVEQIHLRKQMALKVLHETLLADRSLVARFMREARAMSRLSSPHTVRVHDCGQSGAHLYLAMELLVGTPLDVILKTGRLPWRRALRMILQMCDSLGEAHRHGVVHRDLKPENVIVVKNMPEEDFIKVLDFGLAKVQGLADPYTVESKLDVFGTPFYMSPEQVLSGTIDHRTDLYALGAMMFQMLTGRHVFAEHKSTFEMLSAHVSIPAPSVATIAPNAQIPDVVADVVGSLLEKEPDQRIQTMQALAQALRDVLGEHPDDSSKPAMQQGSGGGNPATQMYTIDSEAVVGDFAPGGLDDATQIHITALEELGAAPSPAVPLKNLRMPRESKLPERRRVDHDSGGFAPSPATPERKRPVKLTQDMQRGAAGLVTSPERGSMTATYGKRGEANLLQPSQPPVDVAEEAARRFEGTAELKLTRPPEVSVSSHREPSQVRAGTRAEPWNAPKPEVTGTPERAAPTREEKTSEHVLDAGQRGTAMDGAGIHSLLNPPRAPSAAPQSRRQKRDADGTQQTQAYVGALHPDLMQLEAARAARTTGKPRSAIEALMNAPVATEEMPARKPFKRTIDAGPVSLEPEADLLQTVESTIVDGSPLPQHAPDEAPGAISETQSVPLQAIEAAVAQEEERAEESADAPGADDSQREPSPAEEPPAAESPAEEVPAAVKAVEEATPAPQSVVEPPTVETTADEPSEPAPLGIDPALLAALAAQEAPPDDRDDEIAAGHAEVSLFPGAAHDFDEEPAVDAGPGDDLQSELAAALNAAAASVEEPPEAVGVKGPEPEDTAGEEPQDALDAALLEALDAVTGTGQASDDDASSDGEEAPQPEREEVAEEAPRRVSANLPALVRPPVDEAAEDAPAPEARRVSTNLPALVRPPVDEAEEDAPAPEERRVSANLPALVRPPIEEDETIEASAADILAALEAAQGDEATEQASPGDEAAEQAAQEADAVDIDAPELPDDSWEVDSAPGDALPEIPLEAMLADEEPAPPLPDESWDTKPAEDTPVDSADDGDELPPIPLTDEPLPMLTESNSELPDIDLLQAAIDEAARALPDDKSRPDEEQEPSVTEIAPRTVVQQPSIRESGPLPKPATDGRSTGRVPPPAERIGPAPSKRPIFARTQDTGPVPPESRELVNQPTYTLSDEAKQRLRTSMRANKPQETAPDTDSPWTKKKKATKPTAASLYWNKVVMSSKASSTKRKQVVVDDTGRPDPGAVEAARNASKDKVVNGRVELDPGAIVGNIFEVQSRVGDGNVGVVYKARNRQTGDEVALKILHPHIGTLPEALTRLQSIAADAANINNPAAEPLLDYGKTPDSLYLVSRWMDGRTLEAVANEQGTLKLRVVGRVVGKILNALEAAHSNAVLHGDLSTRNIFIIERKNEPHFLRVVDFELASLATIGGMTPRMLRFPIHLTPEQLAGRRPQPETDFYRLGWLIYRMLGGRDPYVVAPNLPASEQTQLLQAAMMNEEPPPLHELATERLLPGLIKLVTLLMARQPHRRPGSVAEIRDLLKRAGRGEDVEVTPRRSAETSDFTGDV